VFVGRGAVGLWDLAAPNRPVVGPLPRKEGGVQSVVFNPDGKTIAARYGRDFSSNNGVVIWDVAAGKRLVDEPLAVKEGNVQNVAFSPDGKTIAGGFVGRGGV